MFINHGKHIEKEIDGIRCRIVDQGVSRERANFLKSLLEFNGLEVKIAEDPQKNDTESENNITFSVGVSQIDFNPVIAIYERDLRTPDGQIVSPAFWNQQAPATGENSWYWRYDRGE